MATKPTELPSSPSGEILHLAVRDKVNELVNLFPAGFFVSSSSDITIGTDAANPSFLGPITATHLSGVAIYDSATGAMQNTSGKTLDAVVGTVNFQPDKTGGGTTTVSLMSERSPDGVQPYVQNPNSLRVLEIPNTGESFNTKLSFASNWQNGEVIRFRAYSSDGDITLTQPSDTILGQTVLGVSYAWELMEML